MEVVTLAPHEPRTGEQASGALRVALVLAAIATPVALGQIVGNH